MSNTATKLTYLNTTKQNLKTVINTTGAGLTDESTFRSYANVLNDKILGAINGDVDLFEEYPKVSGNGTDLSLNGVVEGKMSITPQGASSQNGEPTPTTPIQVKSVTGENSVVIQNENLFDKNSSDWFQTYIGQSTQAISKNTSSANFKTIYIKCLPNTNYYIKKFVGTGSLIMGTTELKPTLGMALNDYVLANATNSAFLTGENANYLVVQISTNTDINNGYTVEEITNNLSITKGSTVPSEYVEHEEQNYQLLLGNIELNSSPDGTIRDEIIGTPNNWYKREYIGKIVLDGSEDWLSNATSNDGTKVNIIEVKDYLRTNSKTCICNYFTSDVNGGYGSITYGKIHFRYAIGDNKKYLYFGSNMDISDFKTWLSTHNTIVYYILATPQDISITDATLINQLNGIYENAHSYNGVTNIITTYEDGNEQMHLDIEALKNVWEVTE